MPKPPTGASLNCTSVATVTLAAQTATRYPLLVRLSRNRTFVWTRRRRTPAMKPRIHINSARPVPRDLKLAVDYMRRCFGQSISVADLVSHCGVAERTLHKNFRRFLGLTPLGYLRQVRLGAARGNLLMGMR